MKKLGLCVRYDCNNYGSMLQILATQKAIERMGWDYEIIRYDKKTISFLIRNSLRVFNPYFMHGKIMALSKAKAMKAHPDIKLKNVERLKLFGAYRKEYIGPYSPVYKGYNNLKKGAENYDAVMVGSDQLWTPAGIQSKDYNLLFVPENVRKMSLATSFGITEVPKNQVKMTTQYLQRIEFLSVRETTGAEIVRKLTGREAIVAVDPTLMFSGEEWISIFPEKQVMKKPYIFAYFLGTTPEHRKAVTQLSKETGLEVVTCPHMDEFVEEDLYFGDEQKFDIDPVDFLNLIRGAEYICTDSFHGTVFSVLNHKKFLTFNRYSDALRKSKNSRIDSLFELLGLQDRHCVADYGTLKTLIDADIDYKAVDQALAKLREESFDFLRCALNK